MSKLVIIGNGFDRAHDMETTYWHFRKFIEEKHPEILESIEYYNLRNQEMLWTDFENSMSKIDTDQLRVNSQIATQKGKHDDDYSSGEDEGVSYFLEGEIGFINEWSDLILEWVVEYIDLPKKKIFKTDLINDENYFLSFNYTETLEYTYGIEDNKVRHIHGRAGYELDLIMGHRDDSLLQEVMVNQVDYVYDQKESSLMKAVLDYLNASYKDVASIIEGWKSYFEDYKVVDEVHIIGWSINKIDLPYFDLIIELIPNNTPIYIYYYDSDAKTNFEFDLSSYIQEFNITLLDVKDIQK